MSLEQPFRLSFVKVYRNTLSDDLRLVTTTADDAAKITSTHHGNKLSSDLHSQTL